MLNALKHRIIYLICCILKSAVGLVPKDKKLILFSAWFGKKYADNTMYLYEYMLNENKYKIYWFTNEESVYDDLKKRGLPVVYSKTLKAKWLQCRAIMLVSTVQTSDFNPLLLNKCIYLDLDHGFPGKPVCLMQPDADTNWVKWYNFRKRGLKFYQTAASKFSMEMLSPCYDVAPECYIYSNKPRIDVLFEKELQVGKNIIVDKIKKGRKAFVYLPTHRSCGKYPIKMKEVLDLEQIQKICEQSNSVFIIKKHFYHKNEIEDLSNFPNIFDLTNEENIDTQVLLAQTDVLITDFSSCFIDFLALNRPIVFYAYDYDSYLSNERDYYWKYEKIKAGYTVKNKSDFPHVISALTNDWNDESHLVERKILQQIYFDKDVEMGGSRAKISKVIDDLINNKYNPIDWKNK